MPGDASSTSTPTPDSLADPQLRRLAGERSFARGVEYHGFGAVGRLEASDRRARASVAGTSGGPYAVRLELGDDGPSGSCSCPVGDDGAWCKHAVAVAIAWRQRRTAGPDDAGDALRGYLAGLSREQLVDLVLGLADEDPGLDRRLRLRATAADASADDEALVARYAGELDATLDPGGFLDRHEVYAYRQDARQAIDGLRSLLAAGRSAAVVALAEHGLGVVEGSLDHVDDSDGDVHQLLEDLQDLHLDACRAARPDPLALAERLLDREVDGEWDVFYGASDTYAEVLGDVGLARYRELAEERFAALTVRGPEDARGRSAGSSMRVLDVDSSRYREDARRRSLSGVLERLAEADDDPDRFADVVARDLSSGWSFVRIAERYAEAGRDDDALAWIDRGLAAFPDRPDHRLRETAIAIHRRRGAHDRVLDLTWEAFADRPSYEGYGAVRRAAEAVGAWPGRQEGARALLLSTADREGRAAGAQRWGWHSGRDALVRVLLDEDESDAAWRHAQEGGCGRDTWLALADRRRETHPGEALEVYARRVEELIDVRKNDAYREAAELVTGRVRDVLAATDGEAAYHAWVDELRGRHRRKRNLIALLPAG